ncbi:hypothetical protein K1719_001719 [Acacia pycnantha]|nr:hypothetical protein K1719_001719 [Acacia pycnantha]
MQVFWTRQDVVLCFVFCEDDGQTTFHSHSDISDVVFNYNHPAVVDFRLILNRLSAAHLTQDNQIPGWLRVSSFYKTKEQSILQLCCDELYFFFSDVDDSNDTWSVVGKVLRKWVVRRKAAPYAVWKVGMLLADEKGSRIEVSATHKNLIDKLMDQPKEGIVYNFQNFQVLENDDKYRITTTPWKFNFHNHTYIEEADVVISNEAYNLKTIPSIC